MRRPIRKRGFPQNQLYRAMFQGNMKKGRKVQRMPLGQTNSVRRDETAKGSETSTEKNKDTSGGEAKDDEEEEAMEFKLPYLSARKITKGKLL